MMERLNFYFNPLIKLELYQEELLDLDKIANSDYDLIIADFGLETNFSKPWLYINGEQSISGYQNLLEKFYTLLEEKEKQINIYP